MMYIIIVSQEFNFQVVTVQFGCLSNLIDNSTQPQSGFVLETFRRGGRSINRHALALTNICA